MIVYVLFVLLTTQRAAQPIIYEKLLDQSGASFLPPTSFKVIIHRTNQERFQVSQSLLCLLFLLVVQFRYKSSQIYIRLFNFSKYIRLFNFSNVYFFFIKYKNQKKILGCLRAENTLVLQVLIKYVGCLQCTFVNK